ncbi:acetoacetate decarboxylase family protein [Rufibacter tibetensis]|uniref:acetoacetate decarboxylase family protein n=1 Tax=Rufibacter tibetensis TaxID=512763 RepID=UPI000783D2D0|nr:acetoacetate decarboxylase family protein [Rufibacter tibetensis]
MQEPWIIAPAPWSLTGDGIIWLYTFPKSFNEQYGFLADFQKTTYKAGIGAVLLMNYHTSDVGPYQELLFMPALFKIKGKLCFSVSKIYVSTDASAWNGRVNWGIPKELADFKMNRLPNGLLTAEVQQDDQTFFSTQLIPVGPQLPINSVVVPGTRIVQQHENKFLFTKPEVQGQGQLALNKNIWADERFFPPVHNLTHFAAISLNNFKMAFPVAEAL